LGRPFINRPPHRTEVHSGFDETFGIVSALLQVYMTERDTQAADWCLFSAYVGRTHEVLILSITFKTTHQIYLCASRINFWEVL